MVPEEVVAYEDLPPYPNPEEDDEADQNDDMVVNHPPAQIQNRPQSDAEDSVSEDTNDVDSLSDPESEEDVSHCSVCHREVKEEHNGLLCDSCDKWSHRNCLKMKKKDYNDLIKREDFSWNCPGCPPAVAVQDDAEVEEMHPVPLDVV